MTSPSAEGRNRNATVSGRQKIKAAVRRFEKLKQAGDLCGLSDVARRNEDEFLQNFVELMVTEPKADADFVEPVK